MSAMSPSAEINSRKWWEDYFAAQWEAKNGPAQTTYFMQQLLAHLPALERDFLANHAATILDWGCAFGDGVDVLGQEFSQCRVVGLDFAQRAIEQAQRRFPSYEFRCQEDGRLDESYDVVVCSNCLEHFADPLSVIRRHLAHCRQFYVILAPYQEAPLDATHVAQFRDESFPETIDGFTRLAAAAFPTTPPYWNGQEILVVYGSRAYVRERRERERASRELQKWNDYYAALPMVAIDDAMRDFGDCLNERFTELLSPGARVLEAGCGAGWQSQILAEHGRFDVSLSDFSPHALQYAQQTFATQGLSAQFVCEDVFQPGEPQYDMVFNAGVLEHYTFDEQVAFLRGMSSRSRKFVLALVPNSHCYWYWIWRMHRTSRGNWPFGKETPMGDLRAVFEAAGLRFLGHWCGGVPWSELFIKHLWGLDPQLREEILAVHRSCVVPDVNKAYLIAGLGCKGDAPQVPNCWTPSLGCETDNLEQITASLSDALATALGAKHQCRRMEEEHAKVKRQTALREQEAAANQAALNRQVQTLSKQLQASSEQVRRTNAQLQAKTALANRLQSEWTLLQRSRAYRLLQAYRRVRARWLGPDSRTVRLLSALRWHSGRAARFLLRTPRLLQQCVGAAKHGLRTAARHVVRRLPSRLQVRIMDAVAQVRRWRARRNTRFMSPPSEPLTVPGLVSVVLPVYNHAAMLRGAIESVLAQSYRNFELIVVNDGSNDGVEDVLAEYAGHPQVRILTQPNQTLPKALSNGFEFARGEFWTWTSADNLMLPQQLQRLVQFLQKRPDAGMVFADYQAIDAWGQPLTDPTFRPQNRRTPHDSNIHLPHNTDSYAQHLDNYIGPCFLYRSWIGRLLGEYDPVMGVEDYDYWLRLSLVAKIAHLDSDEVLYQYRVHEQSLSGRAEELKIGEHAAALMAYHRERAEFHAQPWTIYADAPTMAWLEQTDLGPHRAVRWTGESLAADAGEKRLLLIHADSLAAAVQAKRTPAVATAAWFPPAATALDQYRTWARDAVDVCFAADDATAARLGLVTSQVFCAAPGAALLAFLTRWANNHVYYAATRSHTQRQRSLPRVLPPAKRAPHVLLQTDNFIQGGLEQVMLDLAACLRTADFEVSLLVLGKQGRAAARARQAGLAVIHLPEEDRAEQYRRLLQDRHIDVVNAHYSLFGAEIAAAGKVPFVQTIHNTYVVFSEAEIAAHRANDPFTSAYACVSQMVAHYATAKLGLPAAKMVVVPNGIDVAGLRNALTPDARRSLRQELRLAAEDFVFLNVGSIQVMKCQAALVRAFADVVRECPAAKLLLAGDACAWAPDYRDQVQEAIVRHGLEKAVFLAGQRDDVWRFYAAADAFVLPSLFEGCSLALAEAIAAGLPVVASAVGSAPDLLPQVGGRLIRPPFGDIVNLDYLNLNRYATQEDPQFVADLGAALTEVCRRRTRPLASPELQHVLDRQAAYQPYGYLFQWLLQGGHPSAARPWTAARLAAGAARPAADTAAA